MSTFFDDRHVQYARTFIPALVLSIALHMAVLLVRVGKPRVEERSPANRPYSRLDATLSRAPTPLMVVPSSEHLRKRTAPAPSQKTLPMSDEPKKWSQAERDEMERFLNELSAEYRPPTGQALAQRARAMARSIRAPEDDDLKEMLQKFKDANVERVSLEMYFDALFRKMNRTAAMVSHGQITKGNGIAAVKVIVDKDGSVGSFTILWAADQQSEIAYIKAVVAQAAPFPVFPADIRGATDTIVLMVCIMPRRYSDGGGASFTRMAQGQTCRSPD